MTPQDKQQVIALCEHIITKASENYNDIIIWQADDIELRIIKGEKLTESDKAFLQLGTSQFYTDTMGRFEKSIYKVLTIV